MDIIKTFGVQLYINSEKRTEIINKTFKAMMNQYSILFYFIIDT